jgi:hypothetical protein
MIFTTVILVGVTGGAAAPHQAPSLREQLCKSSVYLGDLLGEEVRAVHAGGAEVVGTVQAPPTCEILTIDTPAGASEVDTQSLRLLEVRVSSPEAIPLAGAIGGLGGLMVGSLVGVVYGTVVLIQNWDRQCAPGERCIETSGPDPEDFFRTSATIGLVGGAAIGVYLGAQKTKWVPVTSETAARKLAD